jgi:DNA polymerase I-like protein with 3'-5' exonuclease and polymerase domains
LLLARDGLLINIIVHAVSRTPYSVITSDAGLATALEKIVGEPVVGLDCETTGLDPLRSRLRLLQIATPQASFVFDLFRVGAARHPAIVDLLTDPVRIKVLHNAKFDTKMLLHHCGVELRGVFDTLLASRLVEAGRADVSHSLSAVVAKHLEIEIDKSLQASDWGGPLTPEQHEYAAGDAAILLPLRLKLRPRLIELAMVRVGKLEFDCVLPIAAMELAGMALDTDCWRALVEGLEKAHAQLSSELKSELAAGVPQLTLFGEPDINLESPAQIIEALANMGINVEGTRNWQLQLIAKEHSAVARLLEYRAVQKALSSFGQPMLEYIHPVTGRIHADFHQIGATGGRMSCSEPNLQQVPNTPEYRSCFRAPRGRKLITADYSQIELRILADWSQDTALVKALMSGEDLHRVTASRMLNVPLGEVSRAQRAAAKQLNYGIIYGLGAQGLAARIECSVDEAEELIKKYFAVYRGVDEWLREAADRAVTDRENRTRSGRLIHFDYDPTDRAQVAATARVGKNAPIQGSSADITKRALVLLYEAIKPFGAQIVNCVHDEIVVEAPEGQAAECAEVVNHEMVRAAHDFVSSVPITVDVSIGDAWLK